MPTLNEFLPPLFGGFLFTVLFKQLRLYLARADGYRLLFAVSTAALILHLFSLVTISLAERYSAIREALGAWRSMESLAGLEHGLAAITLGLVLAPGMNWVWRLGDKTGARAARRFISSRGDPFEMLLMEFLTSQELLMVTLKSGKVYLGKVMNSINPVRNVESIRLALHSSGHRNKETHGLVLDVDYAKTHKGIRDAVEAQYTEAIKEYLEANKRASIDDVEKVVFGSIDTSAMGVVNFETVIRASEIQTISPFDPDIYKEYFDAKARVANSDSD